MQRILCPQCGAPVEFKSAASVMAVCGACRSTLLKDAESVKRIGEMAEVLEDYSPIQITSTGKYEGKRFDVVGRLQLRYDAGFWNEWYVWFEDGTDGWLSDASGQYAVTRTRTPKDQDPAFPAFDDLTPGSPLNLDGKTYTAADIRRCRAVSGQGELPFAVGADGWEAVVADFRALDEFLTLDYSDTLVPQVYQGKAYTLDDMQRASLREEHLVEESAGNHVGKIKALECPSCGAPISFAAAVATQVICPNCRAQLDCSGDTAEVLAKQKKIASIKTTLALGAKATIDGAPYTLIGLMQCEDPDPEELSRWVEYLLYSPKQGFLWLVESDEGWDKVRVCDRWPERVTDTRYALGARRYDKLYDYDSKVKLALGAFNWRVQVGDVTHITDYALGETKLTRETGDAELGWSASERVGVAQVGRWFNLPELAAVADKPVEKADGLVNIAIFASVAMLFFNADELENGHLLAPIIGGLCLWLPIWIQNMFRDK
ncbi:DUF4178 domain-containing protein [Achromobacter aloeverae]|uniref:DUF4178 domain-containing protein n=1 Tax=Achromobacter aloeverae TaxID=1750518 RepID=A0A4Q1HF73_9BURK|nr:DUF4178 domain-containing protein [Achromobacter aloeverae]RXN84457.1 DUF4178 domain-containing protein [Achromobacter aloeverae]